MHARTMQSHHQVPLLLQALHGQLLLQLDRASLMNPSARPGLCPQKALLPMGLAIAYCLFAVVSAKHTRLMTKQ